MAIRPTDFYDQLVRHGVDFFSGVPDSLLKEFCLCIDDRIPKDRHIITANEGNAVALATGYYLAQKSLPLVYMQNSGLGNAVNPLLSLCDPDVYSIPMLVMIGWRGEPGVKDEPQHAKQGKVQLKLLESIDIPYKIISKDDDQFVMKISSAVETAKNESSRRYFKTFMASDQPAISCFAAGHSKGSNPMEHPIPMHADPWCGQDAPATGPPVSFGFGHTRVFRRD